MGTLAHVSTGVFEPLQIAGLTAFGAAYGIRVANLSRDGRPVPTWRIISYFSGVGLIAIAFVSPLAHLGGELVLAHMIQHLLIADIAALLIVLGLTRAVLQPVMALKTFDRLRFLTLPMVALPLWIVNLYVWHIPALYDATVTNEWLHALQHTCFITFGILMWMPIAGPLPVPSWFGGGAQVGYVVVARLASAGLGNILMWSGTALYVAYAPGQAYWDISATADQGTAGVIMMVEGGLITLGVLAWALLRWASRDAEKQRLLELAAERGVPLTPERAERAVTAGQGARLEERISGDPRPKTS
ncbi:MAG: putative rane protein [Solirubrobacterales bacterium]|jgi:cytochrome c oxidase assembly factor CtaG|nr:putative rane protein [Solirubrobacterales bacterium]